MSHSTRHQKIMRLVTSIAYSLVLSVAAALTAQAQDVALIRQAVQLQLEEYRHHTWGLQYRVHRVDSKDDSLREVIETADGNVSRTLTWRGRALTPQEQDDEETRLKSLTVAEVQRRHAKSQSSDKYAVELITAMPDAMLFTLVAGQPQPPDQPHTQAVFDFTPNPAFPPASTTQSLLTGLAGRIWIDTDTHRLSRLDLRITKNLNLMFGILARVYEGGTLSYEQRPVAAGVYCYSVVKMDVKLRELMLHTAPYRQTLTISNARFYPTAPSVKEAVGTLLAIPPVKP